jgi:hypothetical protein
MANIFNGKLEIISADAPFGDNANQWDIIALYTDNNGIFFALDAQIGDTIYVDAMAFNLGLFSYKIIAIDEVQTTFDTLYATVKWDLYTPVQDFLVGFEGCIGRTVNGIFYLPSASAQGLSQSFLDYARNVESMKINQLSFANRTFNGPYLGERDGFNTVFQIVDPFIPGTLEVHVNGVRQNEGLIGAGLDPNDYLIISEQEIQFTITPTGKDILSFNYNKK